MSLFNSDKTKTHSRLAFESNRYGSEEQNEDGKMEVDLVVAPKSRPTKPKVTSDTWILSSVAGGFVEAKGAALVPTFAFVEVITFSTGVVD
jgi:hypothetical protein